MGRPGRAGMIVLAAAIVLIPRAPLGLLTVAVQAMAGILLPSATVFLLLLCNDRAVLGPWVNRPWLNAVGAAIVGMLVVLSLILATVTLFPTFNTNVLTMVLSSVWVAALLAMGVAALIRRRHTAARPPAGDALITEGDRNTWRMPPLEQLPRPAWSMARTIGMLVLRVYLVLAVLLMLVKVVQLALGHG